MTLITKSDDNLAKLDLNRPGYIILRPDCSWEHHTAVECPSLKEMQKIVGGYIERVKIHVPVVEFHSDMIVDEEGLLKNKEENLLAQLFYPGTVVGVAILFTGGLRLS